MEPPSGADRAGAITVNVGVGDRGGRARAGASEDTIPNDAQARATVSNSQRLDLQRFVVIFSIFLRDPWTPFGPLSPYAPSPRLGDVPCGETLSLRSGRQMVL